MAFFDQVSGQLAGIEQQQTDLRRAVDAGELWMEAGVAETAAQRCLQTSDEINQWLSNAERLTWRRSFGDNEDGRKAAARYAQAGREVMAVMKTCPDRVREHGSHLSCGGPNG